MKLSPLLAAAAVLPILIHVSTNFESGTGKDESYAFTNADDNACRLISPLTPGSGDFEIIFQKAARGKCASQMALDSDVAFMEISSPLYNKALEIDDDEKRDDAFERLVRWEGLCTKRDDTLVGIFKNAESCMMESKNLINDLKPDNRQKLIEDADRFIDSARENVMRLFSPHPIKPT